MRANLVCTSVLCRTCVGSVSTVVSCLHLWLEGGARRRSRRSPRLRAPAQLTCSSCSQRACRCCQLRWCAPSTRSNRPRGQALVASLMTCPSLATAASACSAWCSMPWRCASASRIACVQGAGRANEHVSLATRPHAQHRDMHAGTATGALLALAECHFRQSLPDCLIWHPL